MYDATLMKILTAIRNLGNAAQSGHAPSNNNLVMPAIARKTFRANDHSLHHCCTLSFRPNRLDTQSSGFLIIPAAAIRCLIALHELLDLRPALARVLTPIAIKNVISGSMRELNLRKTGTSNRLLQKIEAMLRVLEHKRLLRAACAVVVRGVVFALEQAEVDVAKHYLATGVLVKLP